MTRCNSCGRENASYIKICPKCGNSLISTINSQGLRHTQSVAKYAGFWRRFAACLIDNIILGVLCFVIAYIFGSSWSYRGIKSVSYYEGVGSIIGIVVSWLYCATMESSPHQATLGKMLLEIIVTDFQGARVSFARATGRHFAKYISGILFCVGYIIAGFTKKKQALHDMMANTLVVFRNTH